MMDKDQIDKIKEAWGRPQLSPREEAELDASLQKRLEPSARRRWLVPAVAVVAAVTMLVIFNRREPEAPDETFVQESLAWLDPLASSDDDSLDLDPEYRALADWLVPDSKETTETQRRTTP